MQSREYGRKRARATKKSREEKKVLLSRKRAEEAKRAKQTAAVKASRQKVFVKEARQALKKQREKLRKLKTKPAKAKAEKLLKQRQKSLTKAEAKSRTLAKALAKTRNTLKNARTRTQALRTRSSVKALEREKDRIRRKVVGVTKKGKAKKAPKLTPERKKAEKGLRKKRKSHAETQAKKLKKQVPPQKSPLDHYREQVLAVVDIAKKNRQVGRRDRRKRRIESETKLGEQRVVMVNLMVTEDNLEEIIHLIGKAAAQLVGPYAVWETSFEYIGMGERLIGSGNRVLEAKNVSNAHQFQIGYESSGVWNDRAGMMSRVRLELEQWADETGTAVYLVSAVVRHYNFRWGV